MNCLKNITAINDSIDILRPFSTNVINNNNDLITQVYITHTKILKKTFKTGNDKHFKHPKQTIIKTNYEV